jgi:hypothetical protein
VSDIPERSLTIAKWQLLIWFTSLKRAGSYRCPQERYTKWKSATEPNARIATMMGMTTNNMSSASSRMFTSLRLLLTLIKPS